LKNSCEQKLIDISATVK